ncbi:hypothetical protein L2E82_01849 [Cichorium intybus]|uniref:Uncharacterized protein n=1 Tax=Cichorium intybus TaxID=13427 RepID=A0ACB9H0I3_CICIN|nr:hypothetical protein L2E82_01849 [Cichorium intybus]
MAFRQVYSTCPSLLLRVASFFTLLLYHIPVSDSLSSSLSHTDNPGSWVDFKRDDGLKLAKGYRQWNLHRCTSSTARFLDPENKCRRMLLNTPRTEFMTPLLSDTPNTPSWLSISLSIKGKEFAVVTMIQLCEGVNGGRNRALLAGEGAIPPLVDLSQTGTATAKHKKLIWFLKVILGSVNMYGKSGALEDARKMFDNMPKRNLLTWNSMMVVYSLLLSTREGPPISSNFLLKADLAILLDLAKLVYRLRLLGDYNYSTCIAFVDFVMVREGFAQKIKDEEGEGCNIYGSSEVNKVAGNFHFIKSFHQSSIHIPDLLAFQESSYNV